MNRELLMLVDAISREKNVERDVVFGAVESADNFPADPGLRRLGNRRGGDFIWKTLRFSGRGWRRRAAGSRR